MKKLFILLVLLLSTSLLFSAGTPVFDWSAFLQFAEEAVQTAERWKVKYDQIMNDVEQAKKTFADFDPSNFSSITNTLSTLTNMTDTIYSEISSETNDRLRNASSAARRIDDGIQSPYYRNNAGYWIDILQEYTVPEEQDAVDRYMKRVQRQQEQSNSLKESTNDAVNFIGSQSNADRDASITAATEKANAQKQQEQAENLLKEGDETAAMQEQLNKNRAIGRAYSAGMAQATENFWIL